MAEAVQRQVSWDIGGGYDLLISAYVLHRPREFDLPAPWAAGVRSRLAAENRAAFKFFFGSPFAVAFFMPLHIVYQLAGEKSAAALIAAMEQLPADHFIQIFANFVDIPGTVRNKQIIPPLRKALAGEHLGESERADLLATLNKTLRSKADREDLNTLLAMLEKQADLREQYIAAIRDYYQVYYKAEEERSLPILRTALAQAQAEAQDKPIAEVLERLTHGVTVGAEAGLKQLVIAPSFWSNPYVFPYYPRPGELLLLYGARPEWTRLVPGPVVPDAAMRTLKALSDPTRVRLLHLLAEKPSPPLELAKALKLSLPTISHHLTELRLAGLVKIEIGLENTRSYTLRWREAEAALDTLKRFIMSEQPEDLWLTQPYSTLAATTASIRSAVRAVAGG